MRLARPIFCAPASWYLMWILTPAQMQKAKQMARCQNPTRGFIVYFFLFPYALAADLNDIAQAQ